MYIVLVGAVAVWVLLVVSLFDLAFQWVMQTASTIISSPEPTTTQYQWLKRNLGAPGDEAKEI